MRVAIRYIHLNPLRGRLVKSMRELDRYPWTGHKQIIMGGSAKWQDVHAMREFFPGLEGADWVRHYREFIEFGSNRAGPAPKVGRIEGSFPPDMVVVPSPHGKTHLHAKFLEILSNVSIRCGVPPDRIIGSARGFSEVGARRQVLQECKAGMNVSAAQICRWLAISEGAGGYLLRSGRRKSESGKPGKGNS